MDVLDSPEPSPSPHETNAFSLHGILKSQESKETPPPPKPKTNLTEFLVKWEKSGGRYEEVILNIPKEFEPFLTMSRSTTNEVLRKWNIAELKQWKRLDDSVLFEDNNDNAFRFLTFEQDTMINYLDKKVLDHIRSDPSGGGLSEQQQWLNKPNEIVDNFLYLGSQFCVSEENLINRNIDYILSVGTMKRTDSWLESRVTLHLPMADDGSDNVQTILVQALPFIEQAKANNKRILIHCRLGVNRSATIVMAYLMKSRKCTLKEALECVRAKRSVVNPHFKYLSQLLEIEKSIHGVATTNITQFVEFHTHQGRLKLKKHGSGLVSQWRNVWLVLDKRTGKVQLFQNENSFQGKSDPFHTLDLRQATLKTFASDNLHFEIVLDGLRRYHFQAESLENKQFWLNLLEPQLGGGSVGSGADSTIAAFRRSNLLKASPNSSPTSSPNSSPPSTLRRPTDDR